MSNRWVITFLFTDVNYDTSYVAAKSYFKTLRNRVLRWGRITCYAS